ncbi:MAG: class I SAM-dependent rRNA methyltransferase [Deltaproteobacteria bacterium]|nr:class I SAM-dependent rRNA methyltransferase [Deltaproteobacteria bacterium]
MTPRRYQLKKEAAGVVMGHHPWIFRDTLSSAALVFRDGDLLKLVDGQNKVLGFGIYEADGAIAIRVLRRGASPPDAKWVKAQLSAALEKRKALTATTDGVRLVNGESDGLPAVVIDRFGDTLVAQSYTRGSEALTRFAATALARELSIPNILLVPAHRRRGSEQPPRALRGSPPDVARFTEDGVPFAADLAGGQKSGTYLDLRGLRRALRTAPLTGARVLNLFSYSGMIGRSVELAGASKIVQVDSSERALAFARAHHITDEAKHELVTADVFEWLLAHAPEVPYDVVIVDPPAMTSNKQQVPAVLAGYKKLYRAAAPLVKPSGLLIAACCTSRIERALFEKTVTETIGGGFTKERDLSPEPDHPVGFPQADYLKILGFRRRAVR